jgi:hypothetical protein
LAVWCAGKFRIIRLKNFEELILSVAAHHLKTIELFGAAIGFFIGTAGDMFSSARSFLPG